MKTKKVHIYKNPQKKIAELQGTVQDSRNWAHSLLQDLKEAQSLNAELTKEVERLKSLHKMSGLASLVNGHKVSINFKDDKSLHNRKVGEQVIGFGFIKRLELSEDMNTAELQIEHFYYVKDK